MFPFPFQTSVFPPPLILTLLCSYPFFKFCLLFVFPNFSSHSLSFLLYPNFPYLFFLHIPLLFYLSFLVSFSTFFAPSSSHFYFSFTLQPPFPISFFLSLYLHIPIFLQHLLWFFLSLLLFIPFCFTTYNFSYLPLPDSSFSLSQYTFLHFLPQFLSHPCLVITCASLTYCSVLSFPSFIPSSSPFVSKTHKQGVISFITKVTLMLSEALWLT